MSEKVQYDCTLGGHQHLPFYITLADFIAARSQEIQVMKTSLSTQQQQQQQNKLAFQTLPRHMRRRAMSHDVRRLPRRIRQIHLNQMKKSGLPTKQKRPSRRYRRRPWNLIEEYTKRSTKKYRWLQTHIWHAKRFHMIERWGYKLPHRPCDKAFRACYRAVAKHCLLQDISYVRCIEIMGNRQEIIEKLKKLTKIKSGLTIGAKSLINGRREGELTLFNHDDKPIGSVNFHWKPNGSELESSLWFWCHAAFYKSVFQFLNDYFDSNVVIKEIDDLCRFRLTGPLSTCILQDLFHIYNDDTITNSPWLMEYINKIPSTLISNQSDYWKSLKNTTSPSEIPPHIILSLIVEDPRYNLPKKRTKILPENLENYDEITINDDISNSPLWDENTRKIVNESRISDEELSELRSKLLVPGSNLPEKGVFVPVILIQRPGTKRREHFGFGSGWDLIVLSNWAKTFWISMIYRSARAGGLRETDSINYEMGKSFYLEPDTEASRLEEERITKESKEIFYKTPPNKRINFNKFNIVSPLTWNWRLLINDWQLNNHNNNSDFSVIRDQDILMEIRNFLSGRIKFLGSYNKSNYLIPVRLSSCKKGAIKPFGIICLPDINDKKREPIEPLSKDHNQEARKSMRMKHQALLKKMRKRRIIERRKNKTIPDKMKIEHQQVLSEYTKKMRQLWLPEPTTIRKSCSREIIGFIKDGGFSFTKGQNVAIGYIVVNSLNSLIDRKPRNRVLMRNTNTRQYRWAIMDVIIE